MKPNQPTTSSSMQKIGKRELRRRVAAYKARGVSRIAGPDDPIYKGGLRMTAVRFIPAPPSQDDDE